MSPSLSVVRTDAHTHTHTRARARAHTRTHTRARTHARARLGLCAHFSVLTTTVFTTVYTIHTHTHTRPTADGAVSHLALTVPPA